MTTKLPQWLGFFILFHNSRLSQHSSPVDTTSVTYCEEQGYSGWWCAEGREENYSRTAGTTLASSCFPCFWLHGGVGGLRRRLVVVLVLLIFLQQAAGRICCRSRRSHAFMRTMLTMIPLSKREEDRVTYVQPIIVISSSHSREAAECYCYPYHSYLHILVTISS